jgi:hypothetical protein
MVPGQVELDRQLDVPAAIRRAFSGIGGALRGQMIIVIAGVELGGQSPLPEIIEANDGLGLRARSVQNRQQECREHGDNRNDDQQFNQRKASPAMETSDTSMHANLLDRRRRSGRSVRLNLRDRAKAY